MEIKYNIHPVEKFLKEGGTIEHLISHPYFLNVREEETENGMKVWVIDYDQINSPRFDPLCDSCRGIVVCQKTNEVVCWPFNRFYNAGEGSPAEKNFDWTTPLTVSKEDGSLIKVYYFDGKWRIATRGTAFGSNCIYNLIGEESTITFHNLFLRALGISDSEFQDGCEECFIRGETILFELCTKENKVVTSYEKDTVFFLGLREVDGFEGYLIENFLWNVKFPEVFALDTIDHVIEAAESLDNLKEGFVVRDVNFNRIKVKSSIYVIAHHTKGNGLTPKRAVDLVLTNEYHEFISYFPEYEEMIMKYKNRLDEIREECYRIHNENFFIEDRKEFAMKVKHYPFSGILFSMKGGKEFDVALNLMTQEARYRLLGAK
jgi:hypothetical protein